MNPSTEDILEKITDSPSNTVFVLPNNKNIIMAAEQCAPLTEKRVIVIPTKSIPQGVSAMLSIDGIDDVDKMNALMKEAIKKVHTALVTTAARDSVFDGTEIKKGSHLALVDDALATSSNDFNDVISTVAEKLSTYEPEYITIFTGEDADDDELKAASDFISSFAPNVEVTIIDGGQPVYRYIVSAE